MTKKMKGGLSVTAFAVALSWAIGAKADDQQLVVDYFR